jgi:hypothetical protein
MVVENQQEQWQIEVGGKIYEAVLSELPDWINEGSLLPGDKIRKGNLRWIEASKVPTLIPFFNAKEKGEPLPIIQTYTEAKPDETVNTVPASAIPGNLNPAHAEPQKLPVAPKPIVPTTKSTGDSNFCSIHAEVPSFYVCGSCSNVFCKNCPKSFGGEVKICPGCDALCSPIAQVNDSKKRASTIAGHMDEGFGIGDFFQAFAYPFRFKPSLIFGALMFMFFTLGQSSSALGGIFLISASIFCVMLANMLTFGVLANTVQNFTQGRLDADFMPSFDDFSIWDDVVHPFFLCIGVYISSFGAFVLVLVVGFYLVFSAASEQMKKFDNEIARVPGTQYYQPDRTVEQSQEVKDLLEKVKQQNQRRIDQQTQAANGDGAAIAPDNSAEFQKLMDETRAAQIEPATEKNSLTPQQYAQMLSGILKLAAPLVVIGFLALLWGLFYFPAACAVAGYSRSFMATINPLVGLDTIKRLGMSYVKILLMGLCILIASGTISGLLAILLSPLDLPKLGNIPAKAIGGLFAFYFSVVFSCVIGFAMYKAADRLKLYR